VDTNGILEDAFGRVRGSVHRAVDPLSLEQVCFRPDPDANSIAWLIWHLTRIQDDHVADVAGLEQVWTAKGWAERFGLRLPVSDTGYGHTAEQVEVVRAPAEMLTGYYDETHEQTLRYLGRITARDLDRVVDESWDPPVTLGVRLVSVINDNLQHAGQAAYVRGIVAAR
jgi:hypothetical protein